MGNDRADQTNRRSIARLLSMVDEAARLWADDELASILEHQMRAPVGESVLGQGGRQDHSQPSLAGVLEDPDPPEDLLRQIKEFAKRHASHAGSPLPREVSQVIYVLAIAAARVRRKLDISTQSPQQLQEAIRWASRRAWITKPQAGLLRAAMDEIGKTNDE